MPTAGPHDQALTAADLARVYRVAVGTIWRWASQDNWRRWGTRPKLYCWEDAQASYERRHPREPSSAVR